MVGVTETEANCPAPQTMPLQHRIRALPRTIPSRASEPIERDLIAYRHHRPLIIDPQPKRYARPPTIPIIGTGVANVICVSGKPSTIDVRNVSGTAVRDRDPTLCFIFEKTEKRSDRKQLATVGGSSVWSRRPG